MQDHRQRNMLSHDHAIRERITTLALAGMLIAPNRHEIDLERVFKPTHKVVEDHNEVNR